MAWRIEFSEGADKDIEKLNHSLQKELKKYLTEYIAKLQNPRLMGHALGGKLAGLWVYRFRKDYRIICDIEDKNITILVVEIGHRSDVYK